MRSSAVYGLGAPCPSRGPAVALSFSAGCRRPRPRHLPEPSEGPSLAPQCLSARSRRLRNTHWVITHVCIRVCIHVGMCVYMCMCLYMYTCVYACVYTCVRVRVCMRVCTCVCVCMRTGIFFSPLGQGPHLGAKEGEGRDYPRCHQQFGATNDLLLGLDSRASCPGTSRF